MAARDLKKLGVELHMGSIVTEAGLGSICVKDSDGNLTRHRASARTSRPGTPGQWSGGSSN
jgi:hypothetical protein